MANNPKLSLSLHFDSNESPISGVGPGVGFEFIKAYFPKAKNTIRIASAYFTLKGYKIGKEFIAHQTRLQILVGREEGVHVKNTIIDEIVDDFGNCEEVLHETIVDLLDRIKNGQFVIKDAREMQVKFHCKFYICDDKYIWHGSANYTGLGLKQSAEQVSVSKNPDEIKLFTYWYDNALKDAQDLLDDLVSKLWSLIKLVNPFDVYIKTLFLLNNLPDLNRRPNAKTPTYYQKGVIANTVNQVNKYGGGIIVAATGLGKTVMGAETALHLLSTQKAKRVILIAPKGVMKNWEEAFESLDIYPKYFNTGVLFLKSSKKPSMVKDLDETLKKSDKYTLILIDEAHFYRNQLLSEKIKEKKSLVYKRLIPVVNAGARIILLTATVYGTNYQNINSLLYLLPKRRENPATPLIPWEAKNTDEFTQLPIATILGLPHVLKMAKDKGDVDENGRTFIQVHKERWYLPKSVKLFYIRYKLFLQTEIEDAFERHCFDQNKKFPKSWFDDNTLTIREGITDAGRNSAVESWLSSPVSMIENIESNLQISDNEDTQNIDGNSYYQKKGNDLMYLDLAERKKILKPIASNLANINIDDKLLKLKEIIGKHCIEMGSKVIVFVNRHLTALYLSNALEQVFSGSINIGCTVEFGDGSTRLKSNRSETLQRFSPRSHNLSNDDASDEEYNVLICTDADGVGINLQDANTVVNYDPPDSADVLFQRAGRILRMTPEANRAVYFYTLAPSIVDEEDYDFAVHKNIKDIFNRIKYRHEKSKNILGSSVISENEYTEMRLDDEEIDIEKLTRESELLKNSIGGFGVESMLNHTAILEDHRSRAEALPDYILSTKTYSGSTPYMFVLVAVEQKHIPILYDLKHEYVERDTTLEILDLISCTALTPKANVEFPLVEQYANQAVQEWCKVKRQSLSSVRKICGMYLQPYEQAKDIKKYLKGN